MSELPLKISYTDKDISEAAKRDRFAVGTYRGVLSDITRQESKDAGHLMFKVVYRALKDPNDAGSIFGPSLYYYQCLPFRNENREGHVPKKFFSRSSNEWLAAHDDKIIRIPQRTQDGLLFKGEVIEFNQEEAAKKEAYDTSFERLCVMWEDESNESLDALKGTAVYFDVSYDEGSDFPSLGNFRQELADGEELMDPETALTGGPAATEETEEEEVEEAPKKAPAKKASKPALTVVKGKTKGKK